MNKSIFITALSLIILLSALEAIELEYWESICGTEKEKCISKFKPATEQIKNFVDYPETLKSIDDIRVNFPRKKKSIRNNSNPSCRIVIGSKNNPPTHYFDYKSSSSKFHINCNMIFNEISKKLGEQGEYKCGGPEIIFDAPFTWAGYLIKHDNDWEVRTIEKCKTPKKESRKKQAQCVIREHIDTPPYIHDKVVYEKVTSSTCVNFAASENRYEVFQKVVDGPFKRLLLSARS